MSKSEEPPKVVKGHCPNCGPKRNATVVAYYKDSWEDDESPVWGVDEYMTLKCNGCDRIYTRIDKVFSEDNLVYVEQLGEETYVPATTYWPAPAKRGTPGWAKWLVLEDEPLSDLLGNVYTALDHDLRVLAAIGARTVFDRAAELLGVDPAMTFAEKMAWLVTSGKIGVEEKNTLGLLTDAGGAAAHRGWKPGLDELDTMMGILEGFLHRNFVLPQQAKRLKDAVPPRAKRKQDKEQAIETPVPPANKEPS